MRSGSGLSLSPFEDVTSGPWHYIARNRYSTEGMLVMFRSRVCGALALALVFVGALMVSATTASATPSGFHHKETGTQLHYMLNANQDGCSSPEFTFPANTAFWVRQALLDFPWSQESKDNKSAFKDDTTRFDLWVDGSLTKSKRDPAYFRDAAPPLFIPDLYVKSFLTNFPDGMTGTHELTGRWYLDGSFMGGTRGEAVLGLECVFHATFTP